MKVSFHGADQDVTGSCHRVVCAGRQLLIDCGMFQGGRELDEENAEPFGFEPGKIDVLLLTHAHLDHCGRIPLLVKRGFHGEIIATAATRELARLVLLDAAHLHEEEAERRHRHNARDGQPLYNTLDALNALDNFGRTAHYGRPIDIAPGIRATFYDAGHILGSASVRLELDENGKRRSIVFSGDLGNPGRPLLRAPVAPPSSDTVVMETTYGDRQHRAIEPSVEELYAAISETHERGGNVVIPTFALERAQEILFYLHVAIRKGRLPKDIPVFLDSPMAISATQIFQRHPECFSDAVGELFGGSRDPFSLPNLRFTRSAEQSMAINRLVGGAIIMAGAGMCTGGRVRHHLRHNLWRREASVIFVGFAANGTLARRIIDGATHVHLFGEELPVHAHIHTINGFSAHADQQDLLAWHRQLRPDLTCLVHGESETMKTFAERLSGTEIRMPSKGQEVDL